LINNYNFFNGESENYRNVLQLSLYKKINKMDTDDLFFLLRIIDYIDEKPKNTSDDTVV